MKEQPSKHWIILGYGVTGQALARALIRENESFWLWDDHKKVSLDSASFLGNLTVDHLNDSFGLSVKGVLISPGMALGHPLVTWGQNAGVPILSDIEWAASFLKGFWIGVTGTNGKSTTVKLIDELLKGADKPCGIFGNYGTPLIEAKSRFLPDSFIYTLELSSYQLDWMQSFCPNISVCLNVTDDHTDHHANFESYVNAKAKITQKAQPTDLFVYNHDNPACARIARTTLAQKLPFSLVHEFSEGGFLKDQNLIVRLKNQTYSFETAACALKGWHNLENMLAALLVVLNIDSSIAALESYKKTLKHFKALNHRLEWVDQIHEIDFYDDSKATNVDAVAMALSSFDRPVILIAGGRDKQSDYTILRGLLKAKVKHLLLIGEAQDKIYDTFKADLSSEKCDTLERAVSRAKHLAKPFDVVLLSPMCSSLDQFKNYEERGNTFKRLVKESH